MSLQKLMSNYADYNLWANTQFINWLSTKSDDQLNADVPSSYPSILKSLHHIWAVEEYWYSIIMKKDDFINLYTIPTPTKDEIFGGLVQRSKTLADEIRLLTEDQLCEKVEVISPWFQANLERYEYLQHLITHSTYHRGQIVTIGRNIGITDGSMTDYNFYNIAKQQQPA
ncbi:MAG: DinB family protein [Saprospiraceae bacterium]|nr:DinB family protein [Saprospiraceae bacterium]